MGAAGLLRHVVGSSAIMREQLDKLAGLISRNFPSRCPV
jgi:hypothetical protein